VGDAVGSHSQSLSELGDVVGDVVGDATYELEWTSLVSYT
jgi:hypothetical protein